MFSTKLIIYIKYFLVYQHNFIDIVIESLLFRRLTVKFTGNILVDWLINPLMKVFVAIFDNIIINTVEAKIRLEVQSGINVINTNLQEFVNHLESFN